MVTVAPNEEKTTTTTESLDDGPLCC